MLQTQRLVFRHRAQTCSFISECFSASVSSPRSEKMLFWDKVRSALPTFLPVLTRKFSSDYYFALIFFLNSLSLLRSWKMCSLIIKPLFSKRHLSKILKAWVFLLFVIFCHVMFFRGWAWESSNCSFYWRCLISNEIVILVPLSLWSKPSDYHHNTLEGERLGADT